MIQTIQYGVIGNPIHHSKSPIIHRLFAESLGMTITYEPILVEIHYFKKTLTELIKNGLKGANVTLPFKTEAFECVEVLTESAKIAGAVNTIRFENEVLSGENTDGKGLLNDLIYRHDIEIEDKRILILGAGGAVRGILAPLLEKKPKEIILTNRTFERAESLASLFSSYGAITAIPLDLISGRFDLIINGTSASLSGVFPKLLCEIDKNTFGYDLMYGNEPTVFMNYLKSRGANNTYDGLGMLVEQAALSFEYWFGVKPETEAVYQKLRSRA